jgi:hypothetical protein
VDVPHQPIEDVDVTVHADVNIVEVLALSQVLLEVLHVGDQDVAVALKVLVSFLVFIAHMNNDHVRLILRCDHWLVQALLAAGGLWRLMIHYSGVV